MVSPSDEKQNVMFKNKIYKMVILKNASMALQHFRNSVAGRRAFAYFADSTEILFFVIFLQICPFVLATPMLKIRSYQIH